MTVTDVIRPLRFRGKYRLLNRLVPAAGERVAMVFGARMRLDLSDYIQRSIYFGTFERPEAAAIKRLLRPGAVAVDVGANVGFFTALFAARVGPGGRVLSFEPSPIAGSRLDEMVRANSLTQCHVYHCALGEAPGELPLYWDPNYHNHSPTLVPHAMEPGAVVPVRLLDDVLDEAGVGRVDLLKVDVEGYEPAVLRGAARSLAAGRIRAIIIEFNAYWLKAAGSSPRQLYDQIWTLGFRDTDQKGAPPDDADGIDMRLFVFQ
jgi:FkbM family methyltransferase